MFQIHIPTSLFDLDVWIPSHEPVPPAKQWYLSVYIRKNFISKTSNEDFLLSDIPRMPYVNVIFIIFLFVPSPFSLTSFPLFLSLFTLFFWHFTGHIGLSFALPFPHSCEQLSSQFKYISSFLLVIAKFCKLQLK